MTLQIPRPRPITLKTARKTDVRTQFGALVYRIHNDKPEILLITSRTSKRWIIPKGWPMHGLTPAEAALQEAFEEGGVKGKAHDVCLGIYSYFKTFEDRRDLPCLVMVYPVKAKKLLTSFREAGQRRRKWFSPKKAAAKVREPELSQILRSFDPRHLR
ncbi:NUDIX hydrolase [Shimia biformata]|uniref:NUDIX hydrolase n=1 Tax=Shimia biformata TaxID=1294299 RepID=UPI0030840086